jgi:hypothetical protein
LADDILDHHEGLCPTLEIEPDGKFSCGLVKRPLHYIRPEWGNEKLPEFSDTAAALLGFGHGCGMEDEYAAQ